MNNKILLLSVNSTFRFNNKEVDIPLSFLREKKFDIQPYYFYGKYATNEIIEIINKNHNSIITICVTVYNYTKVIEILNQNKSDNIIVVFGEYVTQFYKELFEKSSKINFAILGDLEKPFEELYNCNFDYEKLLYYKNSIATHCEQISKVPFYNKEFVMPAFDYLETLEIDKCKRVEYNIQTKNLVCAGKCTFCRSRKGEIVFRDIEDVFKEIYIVNKKYGVQKIFFTDNNILDGGEIAVERLSILCDKIIDNKLNVALKCYFKATSCYNKELLDKMYLAGFTTVFVGLESGNSEDLIYYNKLTTVEDNNKIMKDLKNAKIFPQIGFLMFNPHSTLEKLRENYYFLINHEIADLFMWVSNVRVFKYTPIYMIAQNDNLLFNNQEYIDFKTTFKIKDTNAENIYNFIKEKMYNRILNLNYDFEFMYGFFVDVVRTHPQAQVFESEILKIKQNQIERLKVFFKYLYVNNDLKYAMENYDEFLKSFEDDQVVLANIYSDLLLIYTE